MKKTVTAMSTAAIGALALTGFGGGMNIQGMTSEAGLDVQPAALANAPLDRGDRGDNRGRDGRGNGKHGFEAENVILLVADGMGTAQRNAIRLSHVGLSGELAMDSLPYSGQVHTNSADPETFVTDSAAAATAMASGIKTYNGAIGVDLDQEPVTTALEVAEELGKDTGLVTTSQVTDATPAAFGSHVLDRDAQSKIAEQFLNSSHPEVILGGGEDYWYPEGNPGKHPDNPAEDPSEESAGTEGNLVEQAQEEGYEYVWDLEMLQAADGPMLLGLFANEEMFQYGDDVEEVYEPAVPLTEMTKKALEILSSDDDDDRGDRDDDDDDRDDRGERSDRGDRDDDDDDRDDRGDDEGFFLMVEEEGTDAMSHVNNAELTIKAGIEFDKSVALAKAFAEQDGETLVIVVGDHQTGGMTIEAPDSAENPDESGEGLSAEDGPLPVGNSDQEFMVDWTTGGHAAVDVPLTAMGPGSSLLTGVYENTHIHDVMVQVMRAGD
ncbi:alkaline phosphatase [Arthrobacter monumenti]